MRKAAPAKSFRSLIVWQKAHSFVKEIYRGSQDFPKPETYGLRSQLRRASISVPANIVEGFRRRNASDKIRFLNIAQASLEEARYFIILSKDLFGADLEIAESIGEEVSKLLTSYMKTIEARNNRRQAK